MSKRAMASDGVYGRGGMMVYREKWFGFMYVRVTGGACVGPHARWS